MCLLLTAILGSGTRLWLDRQLQAQSIPIEKIRGYENVTSTHTECARLVQEGQADVALGLHAAAFQHDLGFIPLFQERYDLVIPQEQVGLLHPLLDSFKQVHSAARGTVLIGYDTTHTGEQIPIEEI